MGNRHVTPPTDVENQAPPPPPPQNIETTFVEVLAGSSGLSGFDPEGRIPSPLFVRVQPNCNSSDLPMRPASGLMKVLSVSSLASIASQLPSSGIIQTFMCRICLCLNDLRCAFPVTPCDHTFCIDCLASYLKSQINHGHVELRCPHLNDENQRCETLLTDDIINKVVKEPEVVSKLQRFRATRYNKNMRSCPTCDALQEGDPQQPAMVCLACGAEYCLTHSDAHLSSESCAAFQARMKKQQEDSENLVAKTSKPCPNCNALTHKYTGCNHMRCPRCDQDWCWLCGKSIVISGAYPFHYDRRNPTSKCAGRQFTADGQGDQDERLCFRICRLILLYSPVSLLLYGVAALVYAVACVLSLPCLLASSRYRSFWLRRCIIPGIVTVLWAILGLAIVVPLTLAFMMVGWLVGVLLGILSCPVLVILDFRKAPRRAVRICCWPALLVRTVAENWDSD